MPTLRKPRRLGHPQFGLIVGKKVERGTTRQLTPGADTAVGLVHSDFGHIAVWGFVLRYVIPSGL